MASMQGKLVACVNQQVILYRWSTNSAGDRELERDCSSNTALTMVCRVCAASDGWCCLTYVQALICRVCNDLIFVADIMRSLHIFKYESAANRLVAVAKYARPACVDGERSTVEGPGIRGCFGPRHCTCFPMGDACMQMITTVSISGASRMLGTNVRMRLLVC
jgi:hypothetical protein